MAGLDPAISHYQQMAGSSPAMTVKQWARWAVGITSVRNQQGKYFGRHEPDSRAPRAAMTERPLMLDLNRLDCVPTVIARSKSDEAISFELPRGPFDRDCLVASLLAMTLSPTMV